MIYELFPHVIYDNMDSYNKYGNIFKLHRDKASWSSHYNC